MNIREVYRKYLAELQKIYSSHESAVITDWVFENVIQIKRQDIIKNPDQTITDKSLDHLYHHLEELLQHKPVQYVLGEAWFYKMKLKVDKNVLIPRPETEELVKLVVDSCVDGLMIHPAILDIGTGSGCIAIALKKELPGAILTAIDINKNALELAAENASTYSTNIQFIATDFLIEEQWKNLPVFDIIISNPPYISEDEKEKLDKNVVEFEPHTALFAPIGNSLLFYEKIAAFGKTHLNNNGKIYVETHEDKAKETAAVFSPGYSDVKIIKDLFGKERMVMAVRGER